MRRLHEIARVTLMFAASSLAVGMATVAVVGALRLLFTPDPCIAPGGVVVQLEQPAP